MKFISGSSRNTIKILQLSFLNTISKYIFFCQLSVIFYYRRFRHSRYFENPSIFPKLIRCLFVSFLNDYIPAPQRKSKRRNKAPSNPYHFGIKTFICKQRVHFSKYSPCHLYRYTLQQYDYAVATRSTKNTVIQLT